jgi:hypothetical protein
MVHIIFIVIILKGLHVLILTTLIFIFIFKNKIKHDNVHFRWGTFNFMV